MLCVREKERGLDEASVLRGALWCAGVKPPSACHAIGEAPHTGDHIR